jgi:hypothetical protein
MLHLRKVRMENVEHERTHSALRIGTTNKVTDMVRAPFCVKKCSQLLIVNKNNKSGAYAISFPECVRTEDSELPASVTPNK